MTPCSRCGKSNGTVPVLRTYGDRDVTEYLCRTCHDIESAELANELVDPRDER